MKQIFSLIPIAILFVLISCGENKTEKTEGDNKMSSDKKTSSMADKNLAASWVVSNAFSTGDPSGIDSAVASDFVDHTERGDKNRDSLKAMIVMMHKMFPDSKMDMIRELADDDYVFSWMRITGTSNGEMGMPKGPYDMKAIQVVRFKDGKAVEHWEYMTVADMMKMMPDMSKMMEGGGGVKNGKAGKK
jgi:predicted SnoaL-like aldol condensation-catalyzing enzyme